MEGTFKNLKYGRTRYFFEGDVNNKNLPLVMCIHGIGSAAYSFQTLADAIVKTSSFRVLRLDLYCRGESEIVYGPHTGDLFVEQVQELLEQLDLFNEKIILIGHSMGGAIAALYAHKHPESISKIVFLTPAGFHWNLPSLRYLLKIPFFGRWGFGLSAWLMGTRKSVAEGFFNVESSNDTIETLVRTRSQTEASKWTEAICNSVINFPLTSCDKQILEISKQERPVLIIWAEFDITTPSDECFPQWHDAFKDNPKADFAIIKNTRHNFHSEEIELSNKLITTWLLGEDFTKVNLNFLRVHDSNHLALNARDQALKKFWLDNKEKYERYMI